jgi:Outer membrane receptor for monomeric catechols
MEKRIPPPLKEMILKRFKSILLKFDFWAKWYFFAIFIAEKTYDFYRGFKDRSNYGLGAKWRVFGDIFSVSAAFFLESEKNMGKNRVYEYVDYGDSLGVYKYSNHPNLNPDNYQRISI